ncbi:MAG: SDR family oxidoreductase [Flavobacteriales bacterium]|nr:SDR family oxidoreductase [Flavobacteriales bacterium]
MKAASVEDIAQFSSLYAELKAICVDNENTDKDHPVQWETLADFTEELDGLVYCPGTINLKPFRGIKEEDLMNDLKVNYIGAFQNVQSNLKLLKKAEQASVVFFSTVAVQTGLSFHSSISGAKAALEGLTRSLSAELAPKIRVNCVAPSLTNTSLAEGLLNNEKKLEAANERHPLKRIGSAEELAGTAKFLLLDDSAWMTGQVLHVDGGMSVIR